MGASVTSVNTFQLLTSNHIHNNGFHFANNGCWIFERNQLISLPGLPNMEDIQVTIFPLMERQDQFGGRRNKNGAKSAFYGALITKSSV